MSVGGLLTLHSQILRGPKLSQETPVGFKRTSGAHVPQDLVAGLLLNEKVSTDWVESKKF